jgi:hypothetical protein
MFNLKQLQNSMSKLQKEVKWIPLTYIYITAHFSGLVQALQCQCDGVKLKYGSKPVKWCGHASVFQMGEKCQPSHITLRKI